MKAQTTSYANSHRREGQILVFFQWVKMASCLKYCFYHKNNEVPAMAAIRSFSRGAGGDARNFPEGVMSTVAHSFTRATG